MYTAAITKRSRSYIAQKYDFLIDRFFFMIFVFLVT